MQNLTSRKRAFHFNITNLVSILICPLFILHIWAACPHFSAMYLNETMPGRPLFISACPFLRILPNTVSGCLTVTGMLAGFMVDLSMRSRPVTFFVYIAMQGRATQGCDLSGMARLKAGQGSGSVRSPAPQISGRFLKCSGFRFA